MKTFGLAILLFFCAIIQAVTVDHSLAASNSSLEICNILSCGKGTCNHTSSGRILEDLIPTCECDPGWKQPNVGISIPFLPCVIPDCSLDFSCSGKAPSSAPAPLSAQNTSGNPLRPCNYAVCGNGICENTSDYGYSCKCDEGYETLLNITSAPCVRECSIGADCKNLGFAVGGNGTASAPVQSNTSNTEGTSPTASDASGVVGVWKHIPYLMTTAMVASFIYWT